MNGKYDTPAPDLAVIESDIVRTRASLDRKLHEIERRLAPSHVKAELREALRRRVNPEPYLGWIATGLVAVGGWMAVRGARRHREVQFPVADYSIPT
jgi:Protein of unknown function (DUF3618)